MTALPEYTEQELSHQTPAEKIQKMLSGQINAVYQTHSQPNLPATFTF